MCTLYFYFIAFKLQFPTHSKPCFETSTCTLCYSMFLPIWQHILICYAVHVSPKAPRGNKTGSAENQWEAKKEYPFEVKLNYAVSD